MVSATVNGKEISAHQGGCNLRIKLTVSLAVA
jgi:hypothetical protein